MPSLAARCAVGGDLIEAGLNEPLPRPSNGRDSKLMIFDDHALTRAEVVEGSRWTGAVIDPERNARPPVSWSDGGCASVHSPGERGHVAKPGDGRSSDTHAQPIGFRRHLSKGRPGQGELLEAPQRRSTQVGTGPGRLFFGVMLPLRFRSAARQGPGDRRR